MTVSVTPLTRSIFGVESSTHLVLVPIPAIHTINTATFRAGDSRNAPQFSGAPANAARMGIFSATNGISTRAAVLLLPKDGIPDRVLIGITHGFGQNARYYGEMGWSDPLSPALIRDVESRFVRQRWGPQMLAQSRKNMAMLLIVRARGNELGPFANDGAFLRQVLEQIAVLTGRAFSYNNVEFFTFSSGVYDINRVLRAAHGHLNITAVYSLDPAGAHSITRISGTVVKQFLSGQTGGPAPGFEYMPMSRWANDPDTTHSRTDHFMYLHNHCLPDYCLYLGIQTS